MRTTFIGFAFTASLVALAAFGQPPSPTETPSPPQLISTETPTPTPPPSDAGTVSVPSTLGGTSPTPVPSLAPLHSGEPGAVESSSSFAWSEKGAPAFTVDQAVITALLQNPD